jgi:hypothetical protein
MKAQRQNIFQCDHDVAQKKEMFRQKLSAIPTTNVVDDDEVKRLLAWLCKQQQMDM